MLRARHHVVALDGFEIATPISPVSQGSSPRSPGRVPWTGGGRCSDRGRPSSWRPGPGFLADGVADAALQIEVPRCGARNRDREGRGSADDHASRSVGERHGRNAQPTVGSSVDRRDLTAQHHRPAPSARCWCPSSDRPSRRASSARRGRALRGPHRGNTRPWPRARMDAMSSGCSRLCTQSAPALAAINRMTKAATNMDLTMIHARFSMSTGASA